MPTGLIDDAVRHQAITWTYVDLDLCHDVASLGHSELTQEHLISWWKTYKYNSIFHHFFILWWHR